MQADIAEAKELPRPEISKLEYDLNNIGEYDYSTVTIEAGRMVELENIELRNLRITSNPRGSFVSNTIVFTVRHYLETNIEY